jgi:hypothetical protein
MDLPRVSLIALTTIFKGQQLFTLYGKNWIDRVYAVQADVDRWHEEYTIGLRAVHVLDPASMFLGRDFVADCTCKRCIRNKRY